MICYENLSTDPAFNLSVEESLLVNADTEPLFLLWENAPAVIIGRYQNAWSEVDLSYAEEEGICVIRRLTGGGAVYHDHGNLNYTFITACRSGQSKGGDFPEIEFCSKPILRTLRKMGIDARFSGRNDLTVQGKKFSGTARVQHGSHLLYHGTLLFSTDLEKMTRVLNVDPEKYRSKGVASVRSRVTNLSGYLPSHIGKEELKGALLDEVFQGSALKIRRFDTEQRQAIERLRHGKYGTRAWNIGESPAADFTREKRYDWGKIRIDIGLEKGKIAVFEISGDFFTDAALETLTQKFLGTDFARETLEARISEADILRVFPRMGKEELFNFLFA